MGKGKNIIIQEDGKKLYNNYYALCKQNPSDCAKYLTEAKCITIYGNYRNLPPLYAASKTYEGIFVSKKGKFGDKKYYLNQNINQCLNGMKEIRKSQGITDL